MKHWFVAQAIRNKEFDAAMYAAESGFESYVPVLQRQRTIGRQIVKTTTPRFGIYVFVRFDPLDDEWGILCRHRHGQRDYFVRVLSSVGDPLKPSPVPDEVIEAIRAFRPPVVVQKEAHVYQPGEAVVCIIGGHRMEAVFVGYCGNNRPMIRTWIFGAEHVTEVKSAQLEPLALDSETVSTTSSAQVICG